MHLTGIYRYRYLILRTSRVSRTYEYSPINQRTPNRNLLYSRDGFIPISRRAAPMRWYGQAKDDTTSSRTAGTLVHTAASAAGLLATGTASSAARLAETAASSTALVTDQTLAVSHALATKTKKAAASSMDAATCMTHSAGSAAGALTAGVKITAATVVGSTADAATHLALSTADAATHLALTAADTTASTAGNLVAGAAKVAESTTDAAKVVATGAAHLADRAVDEAASAAAVALHTGTVAMIAAGRMAAEAKEAMSDVLLTRARQAREQVHILNTATITCSSVLAAAFVWARSVNVGGHLSQAEAHGLFASSHPLINTLNFQAAYFGLIPLLASALTYKSMAVASYIARRDSHTRTVVIESDAEKGKPVRATGALARRVGTFRVSSLLQATLSVALALLWLFSLWGGELTPLSTSACALAATLAVLGFHRTIRLLRKMTVRREGPATWVYVSKMQKQEMLQILAFQFFCACYVCMLCGDLPWVSSHLDEQRRTWIGGVDCTAVNASYVQRRCTREHTLDRRSESRWQFYGMYGVLSCEDGGYGVYRSLYDACVARLVYTELMNRARAGGLASASVLLSYVVGQFLWTQDGSGLDAWLNAPLTMLRRRCCIGVAGICRAIGMLSIPALLVNMLTALQAGSVASTALNHVALLSVLAWSVAAVALVLDVLSFRWRDAQLSRSGDYFHLFVSHNWGPDSQGRDNHERVATVNKLLRARNMRTWFDEERLRGDVVSQMSSGIDRSHAVLVCVTREYIRKVAGDGKKGYDDNCKFEFDYARSRHGVKRMIPVVMDPDVLDLSSVRELWPSCSDLPSPSYLLRISFASPFYLLRISVQPATESGVHTCAYPLPSSVERPRGYDSWWVPLRRLECERSRQRWLRK